MPQQQTSISCVLNSTSFVPLFLMKTRWHYQFHFVDEKRSSQRGKMIYLLRKPQSEAQVRKRAASEKRT